MTDLVEQVARALLAVEDSWNDHEWEQVPIGTQRLFLMQARAVIPVVREDCAKVADKRLVIIESPYAGEIGANTDYARRAMRDSLERGEYPIASHLLYTQPGVLDEDNPAERQWGIEAGLAWRAVAYGAVFYTDRGWSGGMLAAREIYEREGLPFEERAIAAALREGRG